MTQKDPHPTGFGLFPTRRTHYRIRPFSLIELIIVVAILMALMSVLLPALQLAKEKAKFTSCASNQKQIATAVTMYTNENDDWLPPAVDFDGTAWSSPRYLFNTAPAPTYPRSVGHYLADYVEGEVWVDPLWESSPPDFPDAYDDPGASPYTQAISPYTLYWNHDGFDQWGWYETANRLGDELGRILFTDVARGDATNRYHSHPFPSGVWGDTSAPNMATHYVSPSVGLASPLPLILNATYLDGHTESWSTFAGTVTTVSSTATDLILVPENH